MSLSRSLAAACVAAVAVAACASESDPGADGPGGSGGRSVAAYLDELPRLEDDDPVVVTYADLARAAEIGGVERPDDITDTDAVVDYVMDIGGQRRDADTTPRVAALLPEASQPSRSPSDLEGFVDDVGWSLLDLDAYVERDTPPRRVAVLDGGFDQERIEGALDDAGDGVWRAGDPEGDLDLADTTTARPIGETLWFTLDDGRLTVAGDEDDIDGDGETLADDPTLAALAEALDDHDVYSALLTADDELLGPFADRVLGAAASPEAVAAAGDLPQCEGITGAAAGIADDGEPLIVLAMAHADEDSAEANVDAVTEALAEGELIGNQRPWSELVTVESVEADGTALVVTARPADMVLAQWSHVIVTRSFPPC